MSIATRFSLILLLLWGIVLQVDTTGAPPQPDWRARFNYWSAREQTRFRTPKFNTQITLTLKNGMSEKGILVSVTSNTATLKSDMGDRTFDRVKISRQDRRMLFRDDFARAEALDRVVEEKTSYTHESFALHPQQLTDKANLLTSIQFAEYARPLAGRFILWTGNVQDVRLNFFDTYQCILELTPTNTSIGVPVQGSFTIAAEVGEKLERNKEVSVFGKIKSVRLYKDHITANLLNVSINP